MPRVRKPQPKAAKISVPAPPFGGQPRPRSLAPSGGPASGPSLQSNSSRIVDLPLTPAPTPASVRKLSLHSATAEKIPGEGELRAVLADPNKNFREKRSSAEALLKHYPSAANVGKVLIQFARKARAREQLLYPIAQEIKLAGMQLALNALALGSEADRGPKIRGLLRMLSLPQQNALLMRWKSGSESSGMSQYLYFVLGGMKVVTSKRIVLLERIEHDLIKGQPLDTTGRDTVLALLAHPALMNDQAWATITAALTKQHVHGQNMHAAGLLERLWQIAQDTVFNARTGQAAKPILSGPEMDKCAEALGLTKPAETTLTGRQRDVYLATALQRLLELISVRDVYELGFPLSELITFDLPLIKSAQSSLLWRDHIPLLVNSLATSPTPVQFAVNLRNERLQGLENWVERLINPKTPEIGFTRWGGTLEVWIERAAEEAGLESPTGNAPTSAQISGFIAILKGNFERLMRQATSTSNGLSSPVADDLRIRLVAAEIAAVEKGIARAQAARAGGSDI